MAWLRFLRETAAFLLQEKKWWLAPIVIAIVVLTVLAVATEGSAFMPVVYTLF